MGLRSRNDPIPEGERAFLLASIKKALQEVDTPVKLHDIATKKGKKGGAPDGHE